jgi:hypothetical protein
MSVPLQNPILGILIAEGSNVLGLQTVLAYQSQGLMHHPKGCVALRKSQTIPLGHKAAPYHMYAFHLHGAVCVVTANSVLWD